jgi:multidrug efflux system outer membrane protein
MNTAWIKLTSKPVWWIIATLGIIISMNSCKLGPNYSRSVEIDQDTFRQDFPSGASIANTPWWELFGDTTLTNLIWVALEKNRDLNTAVARISEARASMSIVRADLYPRINYGVDASSLANTEDSGLTNNANGAINVSYIVDLWGRIRRLNEAALQEYLATEEAYRSLTIVIVSEIANAYLTLRDLDNRLIISEQTAETWQFNLEIVKARFSGGFVSEVDVNQAKIQLSEAKTAIQTFIRLRAQTENAISTLMGLPPKNIPRGLSLVEQVLPPDLPVGLPSELLDRRPDIRAAERRLHAQTARIGATEALKYPSLTLSADMGLQFVDPTMGFAALGAQVLGPIFNNSANKQRVEIEKARTEQFLNNYENTFLNALREVEDAMIAVQTYRNEFALRRDQVMAAEDAARLSWIRYDGGLTSYLEVLDLQRSSFSSQLKASESLQLQLTSTVRLYQALGGGWVQPQDSLQLNYH